MYIRLAPGQRLLDIINYGSKEKGARTLADGSVNKVPVHAQIETCNGQYRIVILHGTYFEYTERSVSEREARQMADEYVAYHFDDQETVTALQMNRYAAAARRVAIHRLFPASPGEYPVQADLVAVSA
jgi:hypothetical protein